LMLRMPWSVYVSRLTYVGMVVLPCENLRDGVTASAGCVSAVGARHQPSLRRRSTQRALGTCQRDTESWLQNSDFAVIVCPSLPFQMPTVDTNCRLESRSLELSDFSCRFLARIAHGGPFPGDLNDGHQDWGWIHDPRMH
jgi:hypothetical protein